MKIIEFINNIQAEGGTNYTEAFKKADELIGNSEFEGNISPCKTFIIFLSDGKPTAGITSETGIVSLVEELTYLKKAIIFSYILGESASTSVPMALACLRNGIFEHIKQVDELKLRLNSYFVVLSLGMNVEKPVWSEPYEDQSGLGLMTTCSIPVYDRSVSPGRFLGVVGIDILMDEFYKYENVYDVVLRKLISKSMAACTNSIATECQINSLRQKEFKCKNVGNCNAVIVNFPLCPTKVSNVFCNEKSKTDQKVFSCCGKEPIKCTKVRSKAFYLFTSLFMIVILFLN